MKPMGLPLSGIATTQVLSLWLPLWQCWVTAPCRRVAVLGDMLELGACARAEHYKIGRIAAEMADILLAYGPNSEGMLTGARTGGMSAKFSRAFTDKEKMIQVLKTLAKPGDAILFKGSRGMQMEQVLEAFLKEEEK